MFARHHPLDVDIADFVDEALDSDAAGTLRSHLEQCLLCRIKRQRLEGQPRVALTSFDDVVVPEFENIEARADEGWRAEAGELWVTEGPEGIVVLVRSVDEGDAVVVPVTVDVEVADDECWVVPAKLSPLGVAIAIYSRLRMNVPASALDRRVVLVRDFDLLNPSEYEGVFLGSQIESPGDPRLEVRQWLIDRLTTLVSHQPELEIPTEGLPARITEQFRVLQDDLGLFRASACIEPFTNLRIPEREWVGIARVDELGVVVLVIDTPSGLNDQSDFLVAHTLLTRCNGSALVVAASTVSDLCDVFDAPGLFGATLLPDGERIQRPQISEMSVVDAVAKYLDNKLRIPLGTGIAVRGAHLKVDEVLSRQISEAAALMVKTGSRAKIQSKKIGYCSVGDSIEKLSDTLVNVLTGSVSPGEIASIMGEVEK